MSAGRQARLEKQAMEIGIQGLPKMKRFLAWAPAHTAAGQPIAQTVQAAALDAAAQPFPHPPRSWGGEGQDAAISRLAGGSA